MISKLFLLLLFITLNLIVFVTAQDESDAKEIVKTHSFEYTYPKIYPEYGISENQHYLLGKSVTDALKAVEDYLKSQDNYDILSGTPLEKMSNSEITYCKTPTLPKPPNTNNVYVFEKHHTNFVVNITRDMCSVETNGIAGKRIDDLIINRSPIFCCKYHSDTSCDASSDFLARSPNNNFIALNGRYALRSAVNGISDYCTHVKTTFKQAGKRMPIVANAGFGYVPFTTLSNREIVAELIYGEVLIHKVCGLTPTVFYPPFNIVDERVLAIAGAMGYRYGATIDGTTVTTSLNNNYPYRDLSFVSNEGITNAHITLSTKPIVPLKESPKNLANSSNLIKASVLNNSISVLFSLISLYLIFSI